MLGTTLKFAAVMATASLLLPPLKADAQNFPNRPIKILVGFPAGGPADVAARFVTQQLGEALSTSVFVENRPGAASMLAVQTLLQQERDGHTLLLCTHYDPINTVLYKNVKFKLDDFAPVSLLAQYHPMIAIAKALPVDTMKDFVAYAKANPGKLNYGAIGAGSVQEISARQLEKLAGIKMTLINFRGAAPAMQEMVAGRLDLYVGPPSNVMPLYTSNQVKVLAVAAPRRLPNAPEIPTLIESGLSIVQSGWLGICAASGTPRPIVDQVNRELRKIVSTDRFRSLIEKSAQFAESTTPEGLAKIMQETASDAGAVVREFGMQIE